MFVGHKSFWNNAVTTAVAVKAAGGKLSALRLVNTTAAVAYLQCFDALAADVVLGTTTPTFAVRLAANESLVFTPTVPIEFLTGLVIAGTTTATGSTGAAISVLAVYE